MFTVNQTSLLFGALLFAFLFFITTRGELAKWLGIFGLAGSASTVGGQIPTPGGLAPLSVLNPQTGLLPSSGVPLLVQQSGPH